MSTLQLNRSHKASPKADIEGLSHRQKLSWIPNQSVCCCYVNRTPQFQIIRITNRGNGISRDFFERTVLPYAKVLFEANSHDQLQVHTGNPITSILSDTIPCYQLIDAQDSFG